MPEKRENGAAVACARTAVFAEKRTAKTRRQGPACGKRVKPAEKNLGKRSPFARLAETATPYPASHGDSRSIHPGWGDAVPASRVTGVLSLFSPRRAQRARRSGKLTGLPLRDLRALRGDVFAWGKVSEPHAGVWGGAPAETTPYSLLPSHSAPGVDDPACCATAT